MNRYLDFDEYIRQGEPQQRERAEAWRVAIGPLYLERFFRNLLLGEQWDLRNRYLHIYPTEEWSIQPNLAISEQAPYKHPTSTPQVRDKFHTDNLNTAKLVCVIGKQELSVKEIMANIGLKDRKNLLMLYLTPAISEGYVRMLYPDKPRHPKQKYLLTIKGIALFNELTKEQ